MSAIGNDAALFDDSGDDAAEAFFKHLTGEDASTQAKPPEPVKEEPQRKPDPEPEETEEQPAEEAAEEQPEGEEEPAHKLADDGAYVKIKVGDEEHEVPVKDLQRLYGQEQSLTKKSMEVAEQRKKVDAQLATTVAATNALLQRAQQRWEPYSKVDFIRASHELSPEEYNALRQSAQAAYEDVAYLQQGLNQSMQAAEQRRQDLLVEQAKKAIEILSGPEDQGGIEGWSESHYDTLRSFATETGLNKDIVDNLVDPAAIRLLNYAYLYQKGKSKVIVTRKVNKTPKQVIKTRQAPEAGTPDKSKLAAATKRSRTTGSTDDAAELFLARWAAHDAEAI